MTAPAVDTDWLRSNPASAFDKHLPDDFEDLLKASAGYRMVFEEWLAVHHQDVLPGFTQPEIDTIYRRLADPGHRWSDRDKAWAKYFDAGYTKSFRPAAKAIRDDLRAKCAPILKANGGDKKDALRMVGQQAAARSVGKALSAAATDAPATLTAWAQVQAFKGEMVASFNTTLTGFTDEHWAGREQDRAKDMLYKAWDTLQRAESAMREIVTEIGPAGDASQGQRAQLDLRLTVWATEVGNVASVTARAADLVSLWAQRNAQKIIAGNFNATFPVIGGLFEGMHLLVGAFGVVSGFFPQLAPISAGISIADDLVDLAGKRVIVAFASRNKSNQVKFAGAKFELSDKFKESPAGKLYLGKEKVKERVQKQVDKVLAVPGDIAKVVTERAKLTPAVRAAMEKKQKVELAVQSRLEGLRERLIAAHPALEANALFNNAIDELEIQFGALERADGPDDEAMSRLGEALKSMLEMLKIDTGPTSLTELAQTAFVEVCKELAPATTAAIGNALGRAIPFVNVAVYVVKSGGSVLDYWAAIHMELVADNMSEEDRTKLQAFVAQQVHGTNPLFHGLDFSRVKIISADKDTLVCEIAGVKGTMTRDTLRFSPDDRSAMQAAVLTRLKANYSPSFTFQYTSLIAAWDELTWGAEEHGVVAATVTATVKGKQEMHTLRLSVLADGAMTVTSIEPDLPPADLTQVQKDSGAAPHIPVGDPGAPAGLPGGGPAGVVVDLLNGLVEANA